MAYSIDKIFPPYPESSLGKVSLRNTICDTLRRTYEDINNGKLENAKYKIRIAITMAKRMDIKLKSYSNGSYKTFFPKKLNQKKKG